jgi:hypothetical protein
LAIDALETYLPKHLDLTFLPIELRHTARFAPPWMMPSISASIVGGITRVLQRFARKWANGG